MSETIYCPICGRDIEPEEQLEGEDGYIYVHDDIVHSDEDLQALWLGVQ